MHLKALNTIIHNGATYKPGDTITDMSETDAKVLIAGGFAVEAEPEQAPAKPTKAAKADKAAAAAEAGAESDGN